MQRAVSVEMGWVVQGAANVHMRAMNAPPMQSQNSTSFTPPCRECTLLQHVPESTHAVYVTGAHITEPQVAADGRRWRCSPSRATATAATTNAPTRVRPQAAASTQQSDIALLPCRRRNLSVVGGARGGPK